MTEFSRENAAWLLRFLEKEFFKKGKTSWIGSLIVLEIDANTNELTIKDLFCEYEDQKLSWDEFKGIIRTERDV
ncbi:MAG: hypothetical protein KDE03_17820 [Rhodobacteraceae bacterium]|nr:hypothetical protein [Paracoccaceae bacterium]